MAEPTTNKATISTEIRKVDPKSLKRREKNARYMTSEQLARLTDNVLGDLGKVDVSGLSLGVIEYQQLRVDFLPADAEVFATGLKRLGKVGAKQVHMVARFEEFDSVFDTLIRVKEATNTFNAGMAMRLMVDLANERLDQLEQENVD